MRPVRAAALLALAALPLVAQLPPSRYERPVPVPSAGWYRLDLDPATRGRMTPDARDLRLLDPDGREVPFLLQRPPQSTAPVGASALSVDAVADGWALVFDLGPSAPRHEAFRFEFANRAAVSGCRLESGDDGTTWRPLAEGDLFRLGEGQSLSRTSLTYPPTADRYLRLLWPRGGEYPDVRRAEALPAPPVPSAVLEFSLGLRPEGALAGGRIYRLTLPGSGAGLRRLRLSVEGAGALSYRLSAPEEYCWRGLAEGTLTRDTAGRWPEIPVEAGRPESPQLRLEIASGAVPPPELKEVWGAFEVESLLFRAQQPGTHRLTYGSLGLAPPAYPAFAPPDAPESLPALALGAESEVAPAGLPAARAAQGAAMPAAAFSAVWPVERGAAAPGELARLEIPEGVYGDARADLADLRLDAGGKQVPYLLHRPAEPAVAGEWQALTPKPGRNPGESEIVLPAPAPGLPLSALELRVAASVFERPVQMRFSGEGSRPGTEVKAPVFYGSWSCAGASALPCRIVIPLYGTGQGEIKVTFQDGDNPPLPAVDAVLWRRRHALYFLAPEGPFRLMAGSPGLAAPRYDLPALEAQLLAMPNAEVALGPAGSGGGRTGSKGVWAAMVGALVLCGAVLLVILARALKKPSAE